MREAMAVMITTDSMRTFTALFWFKVENVKQTSTVRRWLK